MADKGRYYITTAIAYTSRKPHIGNTYEIVLADAIARFRRLEGYDVYFQTGTDEHGQKIQLNAEEAGVTPKAYVDKVAGEVKEIWDLMNTSYDRFIRTTDADHEACVKKIFKKLYDKGDIYKSEYEGWYCVPCESFYTETQLVDGKCPDCGRPVEKTKEESYFFKMSKYADRLMKYIEDNPDFIQPESRKKEMVNNFLKPGLQDLCVSRTSFSWGVPVTFDPKHVIYVWIDALSNYITGLGYDPDGNHGELYKKYWPADVHLIGKDILRFHTIYWPIMLMALDVPLPKQVFGHPWLLFGADKMSKSKGNVIYADELVKRFGVDGTRYYVLREMPFASDGNITYETLIGRFNSDLANTVGNLVSRTVAMGKKYFGGVIQTPDCPGEADEELRREAEATVGRVVGCMGDLHVADALEEIINLARRSNKYIDVTMPWVLAKDEAQKARLGTVLYNLLESLRFLGVLISPFLPETGEKILDVLNVPAEMRTLESLEQFGGLKAGTETGDQLALFARLDEAKVLAEVEEEMKAKMAAAAAKAEEPAREPVPASRLPEIGIEDFEKCELRVGEILECKKVEKSKKLLCSQIKIGDEVRQIVSGIAKHYTPEQMVGRKVIVVTNLKPVVLCGVESYGMVLCASDDEGNLALLTPSADMPAGAEVR